MQMMFSGMFMQTITTKRIKLSLKVLVVYESMSYSRFCWKLLKKSNRAG